jgi:chromosome segregation ATPase
MASIRELEHLIQRTYARLVEVGEAIPGRLALIDDRLNQMEQRLMADLSTIQKEVQENREVISSAVTLIQGLRDEVAALKAAAQNGASTAELQAMINDLAYQLDQNTAPLANAIAANTPVENNETPAEPEAPVIPVDPEAPATVDPAVLPEPTPAEVPPDQPAQ